MKFGLNNIMKNENDQPDVEEAVVGGIEPEVVAEAQDFIQDSANIEELAQSMEDYREQLENLQELQANHETQVQVMDGDLSVSEAGDIGSEVGDDNGEILQPESSEEQIEQVTEKLENDLSSALANIGGVYRSGRFAQSSLGKHFESDMKRLKGKAKYRRAVESIGDVAEKIWNTLKGIMKLVWDALKALGRKIASFFKADKKYLETLKKELEERDDASFEEGDEFKANPALKAAARYYLDIETKEMLELITSIGEEGKELIEELVKIAKDANIADNISEDASESLKTQAVEKIKQKILGEFAGNVMKTISGAMVHQEDVKDGKFFGLGISKSGLVGVIITNSGKIKVHHEDVGFENEKQGDIPSDGPRRKKMLLDIIDQGIALADVLESKLYKTTEMIIKFIDGYIDNIHDYMGSKINDPLVNLIIRIIKPNLTMITSAVLQATTAASKCPSGYASAVKCGMSIFHAKK